MLRELDGKRNGYVVRFLNEANVLPFVPLGGVDFSKADLRGGKLQIGKSQWDKPQWSEP